MGARPCTLLHGDLFLVNAALERDQVTFFDWALATWGPSWLEATMFLMGALSNVDATYDELVNEYRDLSGDDHDPIAMHLAIVCTLCDLGWNKALDAADHPDEAKRAQERAELDWWVDQTRSTLSAGLLDIEIAGGLSEAGASRHRDGVGAGGCRALPSSTDNSAARRRQREPGASGLPARAVPVVGCAEPARPVIEHVVATRPGEAFSVAVRSR
jgi:hypothetical protein